VPGTIGDHLILDAVRSSGGTAIAIPDAAMEAERRELGRREGLFVAPEAAATLAAARELRRTGWLSARDEVVAFLTGD
jgi:threonine synthase